MPPQRKGAIERGKRSESSRCRNERVKRRYRFLVQSRAPPFRRHGDRHDAGHAATICHSCQRKGIENHPATSNCKNLPGRKTLHLNSPPFPRGVLLGISPFLRRCRADGRHLSRRGSSRGKRRQTGSRASSGRVIIIQSGGRDLIWDILLSPFFPFPPFRPQQPLSSSLISDNSSKRVSEPGTQKGSCYDENDRWPEKCAASSERASGMEWGLRLGRPKW